MLSKTISFKEWQLSLYELSIVSFGIIIAQYWPIFFQNIILILWVLFIVPGVYIFKIVWDQIKV
ncbi:MAG: hypothetical protein KY054_01110 [Candidatus Nealsonbacteria bacterium]|nr:hypothetical protein [Candidatus Nealsonbacteria bacterium]